MSLTSISRYKTARLGVLVLMATGLIAGCSGTDSAPPPALTAPGPTTPAAHGVTGQISAINGGTWTVHSARGKDVTVTITPQTQFGTKKAPATADKFTVGQTVRVTGQRDRDTISAARIAEATKPPTSVSPSPPPPNG